MKTNNEQGRTVALIVGIYFIAKSVLNLILGGGVMDIIISAVEAVALYSGLMYLNYVVAAIAVIVVLKNLIPNIQNLGSNWIYLLEGIVDVVCALILCFAENVKAHFTNKWSEFFGGEK